MKIKVMIEKMKCLRCGHTWIARKKEEEIRICPRCKSPYFNRERKDENKKM